MVIFFKSFIRLIVSKLISLEVVVQQTSYSQAGEDIIVCNIFSDTKILRPTYLELGTSIPDFGNNTFKLYLGGSRGVLVEADATLIDLIKSKRGEDKVLNLGVNTSGQKEADFFVFSLSAINTFSREEAESRENSGAYSIVKTVRVPLKTINEIIAENFIKYPDFLSIDIEGLDLEVLKSLDYSLYPIPVICAETCIYSETGLRPKNSSIANYLTSKGYFIYADTYINTIFVYEDWFNEKVG